MNFNAFIYWWASSLADDTTPYKVLWTLGQWSRFVRPGWNRVTADGTPTDDVLISAFTNNIGTQIAIIVVINMGVVARPFSLRLDSGQFGTVAAYRTSATESMAPLATIPGGFTAIAVSVPAESITTYISTLE